MTLFNLRLIEWFKITAIASLVFFITACDSELLSNKTTEENGLESITSNKPISVYLNDKEVMEQFLDPESNKSILLNDFLSFYPQDIKIDNNILSLNYIVENKAEKELLAINFFTVVSLTNSDIIDEYKVIQLSLPVSFNFLSSISLGNTSLNKALKTKSSSTNSPAIKLKDNGKKSLDLEQQEVQLPKLSSLTFASLPQNKFLKVSIQFDLNQLYLNPQVPLLVKTLNADNYSFSGVRTLVKSAFYEDLGLLDFTNDSQQEDKEEMDNSDAISPPDNESR